MVEPLRPRNRLASLLQVLVVSALIANGLLSSAEPVQESQDISAFLKQDNLKESAAKYPKTEMYRLSVDRSFDPALIFEIDSDAIFLKKVRLVQERKGDEFTSSFRLVRDSRIPIDAEEHRGFKILLAASSFWSLPSEDWQSPGLDGSSWVLEGIKDGKYHRVERSSPFNEAAGTPLNDDLKKLAPERIYSEGRLVALFTYLWGLSGEANEKLY